MKVDEKLVGILKWQLTNLKLEEKVLVIRKVAWGEAATERVVEKDRRFVEHHRIILYYIRHIICSNQHLLASSS